MTENLTMEEKATNFETMRHIEMVRNLINGFVRELLSRGELHDQSKLEHPEVESFAKYTSKLAAITYGSAEYETNLKEMEPALMHHYAKNRHHPQHWKNGVDDMTLVDLVELYLDWCAAASRHNDGNILKSIEKNANKYSLSPQLVRILENTAKQDS